MKLVICRQLQTRLLRVLEAGKVSRIGGERDITLDVRVIAATHNNLKQKIIDGLFRLQKTFTIVIALIF